MFAHCEPNHLVCTLKMNYSKMYRAQILSVNNFDVVYMPPYIRTWKSVQASYNRRKYKYSPYQIPSSNNESSYISNVETSSQPTHKPPKHSKSGYRVSGLPPSTA